MKKVQLKNKKLQQESKSNIAMNLMMKMQNFETKSEKLKRIKKKLTKKQQKVNV